jgi:hypothetical protein
MVGRVFCRRRISMRDLISWMESRPANPGALKGGDPTGYGRLSTLKKACDEANGFPAISGYFHLFNAISVYFRVK